MRSFSVGRGAPKSSVVFCANVAIGVACGGPNAKSGIHVGGRIQLNIRSFSALPLVLVAAPAFAQANAAPQTPTTIVVTGSPVPVTQVGQSVSQISRADIDAVQGSDLVRVLERLPGVSFARNGGPGAQTSLFVRGGDSDQLLVLIDGVRVADLASPGGNYDTGPLALTSISHIELLRGSNSVVWGSQAMAGVLAITTRAIR